MIDDLPELGDIFSKETTIEEDEKSHIAELDENDIFIYISKEHNKWVAATFIDIAPGGIGLHVVLPVPMEFSAEDLNKVFVKFVKKSNNDQKIIKKAPVLVRWQERDTISGKMKLGLHFHGDVKSEEKIVQVLKALRAKLK